MSNFDGRTPYRVLVTGFLVDLPDEIAGLESNVKSTIYLEFGKKQAVKLAEYLDKIILDDGKGKTIIGVEGLVML